MATEHSCDPSSKFLDYQTLAAEYEDCVTNCQASLDQLLAAERELRASAARAVCDVDVSAAAEIERAILAVQSRNAGLNAEAIKTLSHRERNVFELIGQGLPTGAIAECLCIAVSTVETYRERLKGKLKLDTGLELTRFAILWFARNDKARK